MSHIVQIETEMFDPQAISTACRRLGLKGPVEGTAQLFSGSVTGLLVELPGWQYPVVIDTTSGPLRQLWRPLGGAAAPGAAHANLCRREGRDRGPPARPLGRRAAPGR